jgi:hypothetical protein
MPHSEAQKPWLFLAYIAGDNNLSEAGLEDIEELCQTGSNQNVHAAVQIDTYGEHDGSVRYEITPKDSDGIAHRTVIRRLRESNSGNPVVLRNFLRWGMERYPAERRLVVIWNHGSGFRAPRAIRSIRRDIGYDDFGTSMDMPEVADALTKAGIGQSNKIAVLGFDACLMNMLEIANHFSDHAEILVGSEQTEPGDGWPYDRVLSLMHTNPSPRALAGGIVDSYIEDYTKNGPANVTQSAIDLTRTDGAVVALAELGRALSEAMGAQRSAIRHARLRVQSYEYADYVDLQHLAELLKDGVPEVGGPADAVIRAVQECVIRAGKFGPDVADSHGLSVWFPMNTQQYGDFRSKYMQLKCNRQQAGWVGFLDSYFV